VLEALYKSREQTKQTIYEIIGLSDIMRGATKATETLGAQELKSRWGSVRLQRMQKEVQRFVRDILRLKGEVIAEHYEPELLSEMTQIKLPTAEQKQALQEQIQRVTQAAEQAAMAAEQAQQEPPQPPPIPPEMQELLNSPTWDDVIGVLRSDAMRTFRVAIESDSTIASMVESDMQGNREVVETLGAVFASIPTLQQAGAQNAAEVVKEIALALIRHSRFGGRLVEDSIEDLEFADGGSQLQQIEQAIQQLTQQVTQGGEQVAQIGQTQQQHTEIIGQLVRVLQATPGAQPGQQPQGQPQQPPQAQPQPQQPVRAV
jgi:predicted HAD superfamily Cof-like phosphohydrolase